MDLPPQPPLMTKTILPGLTATLSTDPDPAHPRDGDQTTCIATWHDPLDLSERPDLPNPREFLKELYSHTLQNLPGATEPRPNDVPYRVLRTFVANNYSGILRNLYLDRKPRVSFTAAPFTDPWDWDQVGYIYINPDRMDSHNVSPQRAGEVIHRELATYQAYLNGMVYLITVTNDGQPVDRVDNIYPEPSDPALIPAPNILDSWLILMDIPGTTPDLIKSAPWRQTPSAVQTGHNPYHPAAL